MKGLATLLMVLCLSGALVKAQDVPAATQPDQLELGTSQFFKNHLFPWEPMYAVFGGPSPSPMIKFQFSLRYQPFSVPQEKPLSFLNLINFAYSQTSLWDVKAESSPFKDSSYRPELILYKSQKVEEWPLNISQMIYQGGFKHESNGKADPDSRSMNIIYGQVTARFGKPGELNLQVAPRVWTYITGLEDNPDIYEYRGYADLQTKLTFPNELMVGALLRMGNHLDRGSIQVDISYPLSKVTDFDTYLYVQYFNGFGESLVDYKESSQALRIGVAIVR